MNQLTAGGKAPGKGKNTAPRMNSPKIGWWGSLLRSSRSFKWAPWLLVLLLTGLTTLWRALQGRALHSVLASAAGVAIAYLAVSALIDPAIDTVKSARPLALRVKVTTAASRAAGERVATYHVGNRIDAIAFYSDGVYPVEMDDPDELTRHLDRAGEVFAVVNTAHLDELPPQLLESVVVIDSFHLSRKDLLLISNTPHPEGFPLTRLLEP